MRASHWKAGLTVLLGIFVVHMFVGCDGGSSYSVSDTSTKNAVPVANAGPDQNVTTGALVTLDGSASSDGNGDMLIYIWSFESVPAGSAAKLSPQFAPKPTFTADLDGAYVVRLVVNDGSGESMADTVTITAATENSAPVANAGADQNVTTGALVTLDGSGSSDANGDALVYAWSFDSVPSGSTATLVSPTTNKPSFTADLAGSYVVRLVVNDGTVDGIADTVTVTAATGNSVPVANAGADQNVIKGEQVSLDGSGSSDANGDLLTYLWSFVSVPSGSTAALASSTTAKPSFKADLEGSYVVRLVVNDGTVDSVADTVTITASNSVPVANAGPDQSVIVGATVTLNGSGSSDANGDPLSYSWSFASVPSGSAAALSSSTTVNPSFTAGLSGTYVVSLVVNDGVTNSVADTVEIQCSPASP